MSDIYLIGTPDNVLAAFPASGANEAGIADTKAYIAAMKAAGLGTATQIDQGGEGWDTGRELADAINSAKSTASGDVKNALEKQKLSVGGIIMYTWTRTSSDHASMIDSGQSAMVTVAADSSFTVLPHTWEVSGCLPWPSRSRTSRCATGSLSPSSPQRCKK